MLELSLTAVGDLAKGVVAVFIGARGVSSIGLGAVCIVAVAMSVM